MLDHEYGLLVERLDAKRGDTHRFFVFADTVAAQELLAQGRMPRLDGRAVPGRSARAACEIIIHVRMLDKENVQQQEALGIIGVNLLYGALYLHQPSRRAHRVAAR